MHYPSFRLFFLCIALSLLFIFSACVQKTEKQKPVFTDSVPAKDLAIRGYFSDQLDFHTDSNRLDSFFLNYPLLKKYAADVKEFYGYRQFHFAWYDSGGLSEQANNLYNHLNNLDLEGIMTDRSIYKQTGQPAQ